MIRPTTRDDVPALVALADGTGVFKPHEIETLQEVLDDYFASEHDSGHRSTVYESNGQVLGFTYYAPAPMTDRTWELWWIAVTKREQAAGIGSELLKDVETEIRNNGGRVLFIETSSLPHYEPTRRFYLKHGYDQEAVMRDYYSDGDDMVVFRKRVG